MSHLAGKVFFSLSLSSGCRDIRPGKGKVGSTTVDVRKVRARATHSRETGVCDGGEAEAEFEKKNTLRGRHAGIIFLTCQNFNIHLKKTTTTTTNARNKQQLHPDLTPRVHKPSVASSVARPTPWMMFPPRPVGHSPLVVAGGCCGTPWAFPRESQRVSHSGGEGLHTLAPAASVCTLNHSL